MLKPFLFFCLLLTVPSLAQDPFTITPVSVRQVSPGLQEVTVTVATNRQLPMAANVPIAYSDLHMEHAMQFKGIQEENLLDSLFEIDLNSDGMLDELFVDPYEGGARIDQMGMKAISAGPGLPEHPYREDGDLKRYRLGPSAVDIMLRWYNPPNIALYLGHLAHVPQVKTFPSPSLQLHIFEICKGYENAWDPPVDCSFKVALNPPAPTGDDDAEPKLRQYYSWQPFVLDPRRGQVWTRGMWVMLPLKQAVGSQTFTFTVQAGQDTPFIGLKAEVCYAPDAQTCMRTPAVTQLLWAPPQK